MAKAPTKKSNARPGPAVRIIARREGWRRCGMAHSIAPTIHDAGRFTEEEVEALVADPQLIVDVAPEGYEVPKEPAPPQS